MEDYFAINFTHSEIVLYLLKYIDLTIIVHVLLIVFTDLHKLSHKITCTNNQTLSFFIQYFHLILLFLLKSHVVRFKT